MAYAALVSLKTNIERFINSSRISIIPPCPNITVLCKDVGSLLQLLLKVSGFVIRNTSETVIADLDLRIIESVCKFEDVLESHISNQLIQSFGDESFTLQSKSAIDLQKVDQEICYFITKINTIYAEVIELSKLLNEDDDEINDVINIIDDVSDVSDEEDDDDDDDEVSSRLDIVRSEKKGPFAALISLMDTIECILYSSRLSIIPSCPQLESVYKHLVSLQLLLERSKWKNLQIPDLDRQIKEATCELKHALQSHIMDQLYSLSETLGNNMYPSEFTLDLQKLEKDINFFTTTASKIKEQNSMKRAQIVGLNDELLKLKDRFILDNDDFRVITILGMLGIGKTTLVREVYEDPSILNHFQRRAWIKISPEYKFEEIYMNLLDQLSPGVDEISVPIFGQNSNHLYNSLIDKRYLIVLDDVWDIDVYKKLKRFLPDIGNGSRIVLTTRLEEVAKYACSTFRDIHKMRFLSNDESWILFLKQIFAENSCPYELEKIGKKIVQNCEGLPLAIIIVGKHLSKLEKKLDYWTNVAEKRVPVFDCPDHIEVIFSSYKYLPLHLKACFLYMLVFPQDSKITASELIKLWCAEGLLESNPPNILENFATQCLEDLVSKSLVMVREQSFNGNTKICGVHYIFQYLCLSEANKYKFFHFVNRYAYSDTEAIKGHRRLCIHNNVLLGIKDVYESIMYNSSTLRSLLCTGPYHKYPLPMCFGLSLLRVFNAITVRFYTFPFEILKLVQLKYLAFTYNGKFPSSISKLLDLQYLIVRQHMNTRSIKARSYLPIEIWDMKELRHLQVMGNDLPDPHGGSLPNLTTLSDISPCSCTKEVFKGTTGLKKLGIRIVLAPNEPLRWFNDLDHLNGLESLKCVIVNPSHTSRVDPFPALPSGLKELSLSGFGYPWEYMNKMVDKLMDLEVLKLRGYAFRGPFWEAYTPNFYKLKYLLIEDCDLEYWGGYFPNLERLIVRHCYKLREIGPGFSRLEMIELVDCNPLAGVSAKQIQTRDDRNLQVSVHFSGDDA